MIFLCEGKVGPTVREAEYLWTTVAYILWPAGARKLLAELPGAELAVSVLRSKRGYSGSILCCFFSVHSLFHIATCLEHSGYQYAFQFELQQGSMHTRKQQTQPCKCKLFKNLRAVMKTQPASAVNQPVDNFMSHLMAARKLRGFAIVPKVATWP